MKGLRLRLPLLFLLGLLFGFSVTAGAQTSEADQQEVSSPNTAVIYKLQRKLYFVIVMEFFAV